MKTFDLFYFVHSYGVTNDRYQLYTLRKNEDPLAFLYEQISVHSLTHCRNVRLLLPFEHCDDTNYVVWFPERDEFGLDTDSALLLEKLKERWDIAIYADDLDYVPAVAKMLDGTEVWFIRLC